MSLGLEEMNRVYEWRQARASGMGGACFTLAGLILSPLLAAVFDSGANVEVWSVCASSVGALLAALAGLAWHRESYRLQQEYISEVEAREAAEQGGWTVRW